MWLSGGKNGGVSSSFEVVEVDEQSERLSDRHCRFRSDCSSGGGSGGAGRGDTVRDDSLLRIESFVNSESRDLSKFRNSKFDLFDFARGENSSSFSSRLLPEDRSESLLFDHKSESDSGKGIAPGETGGVRNGVNSVTGLIIGGIGESF